MYNFLYSAVNFDLAKNDLQKYKKIIIPQNRKMALRRQPRRNVHNNCRIGALRWFEN